MNIENFFSIFDTTYDHLHAEEYFHSFVIEAAVSGQLSSQSNSLTLGAENSQQIPVGWQLVNLGETGQIFSGTSVNTSLRKEMSEKDSGIPFLATKDVGYKNEALNYDTGLLADLNDERFKLAQPGTLFICAEGGSAGKKIGISDRQIYFGNKLFANQPKDSVIAEYLRLFYMSKKFQTQFKENMTGIIGGISKKKFEKIVVPLPPLNEQKEIVAKYQKIQNIIQNLILEKKEAEKTRCQIIELAQKSSKLLIETDESREKTEIALSQTLHTFIKYSGDAAKFKNKILKSAFEGCFSSIMQNQEALKSAETLLNDLRSQNKKSVRPCSSFVEEITLPKNWAFGSLSEIMSAKFQNGISPPKTNDSLSPKALTLTATSTGFFIDRHFKHVSLSESDASKYWLEPGDLLFQRGNSLELVGMCAIYSGPKYQFVFPDLMIRTRISSLMNLNFVHLWCISPNGRKYLMSEARGAQKTMPKINQNVLKKMPIPIPPRKEQDRLVQMITRLFAVCDQIDESIAKEESIKLNLLGSLMK